MGNALNMMITINVINRIDSIVNKLNDRRHQNKYYHPKFLTNLGDMLIDAHKQRMNLKS